MIWIVLLNPCHPSIIHPSIIHPTLESFIEADDTVLFHLFPADAGGIEVQDGPGRSACASITSVSQREHHYTDGAWGASKDQGSSVSPPWWWQDTASYRSRFWLCTGSSYRPGRTNQVLSPEFVRSSEWMHGSRRQMWCTLSIYTDEDRDSLDSWGTSTPNSWDPSLSQLTRVEVM